MIKDRIIEVLENKGIGKEDFYVKIGMTSASFRGKAKNTPLNSTAIENILSEIPDLNAEWLLTGRGEMCVTNDISETHALAPMEERLLAMIKEKDAKIEEQAKEIGRLEERIEALSKKSIGTTDVGDVICVAAGE